MFQTTGFQRFNRLLRRIWAHHPLAFSQELCEPRKFSIALTQRRSKKFPLSMQRHNWMLVSNSRRRGRRIIRCRTFDYCNQHIRVNVCAEPPYLSVWRCRNDLAPSASLLSHQAHSGERLLDGETLGQVGGLSAA